jgi:hypothetical protein
MREECKTDFDEEREEWKKKSGERKEEDETKKKDTVNVHFKVETWESQNLALNRIYLKVNSSKNKMGITKNNSEQSRHSPTMT